LFPDLIPKFIKLHIHCKYKTPMKKQINPIPFPRNLINMQCIFQPDQG
jgi:hypothetical protein